MERYLTLFIIRRGLWGYYSQCVFSLRMAEHFFVSKKNPDNSFGLCYMLSIAVFSSPYTLYTIHLFDRLNFLYHFLKRFFHSRFPFFQTKIHLESMRSFFHWLIHSIEQSVNQSMDKWIFFIHARVFVHGVSSLHLNATVSFKNAVECVHVSLLDGKS